MNAKPTPDWTIGPELSSGRFGGPTIKDSGRTVAVVFHGGGHRDEQLLTAAANSFRRHFADPVAAAESDLLGELIDACQFALKAIESRKQGLLKPTKDDMATVEYTIRQALSRTKGGEIP